MSLSVLLILITVTAVTNGDHPIWLSDIEEENVFSAKSSSRNLETVYRLPVNVIPLDYDVYIDLYFAERSDRPFSYDGRETIIIQVWKRIIKYIILYYYYYSNM